MSFRMNHSVSKFYVFALAALFTVVVSGCSGGGGGRDPVAMAPPTMESTPDEPMEPTPAEQLATANTALETAQAAVAALTSTSTAEEAAAAYGALAAARTAVHAATNLPANQIAALQAQIDMLTTQLDTANTVAMQAVSVKEALATATAAIDGLTDESTDMDVEAARTAVGDAQAALAAATDLPQDVSDNLGTLISSLDTRLSGVETARAKAEAERKAEAAAAAMIAAATEAAGTKAEAIGDEARQDPDDGAGGKDAASDHMIAISRDRDGTEVEITVDGAAMDDPKFEDQMAGLDAGRTMLVREIEAEDNGDVVREIMIVGTDIAAPKAVAFAKFEAMDGTTPQALNARDLDDAVNADDEGSAADDWTALFVGTGTETVSDEGTLKLVMSTAFVPVPGGTSTMLTFAQEQAAGDAQTPGAQKVEAFETMGSYNGTDGTYRCDGDDACTVSLNAKGELTEMSTGWVFTPNMGATTDQPDYEYLSYGFWLKNTTDSDGAVTYDEVETFAMQVGLEPSLANLSAIGAVTGSATYEGGAVGVYVKNVLDDQANIVSATSGHFKADVELTAKFGGGNVGVNNQFAIGGTMDKFVLQHGEENDWAVSLGLADFSGRDGMGPGKEAAGNSFANTFKGEAVGDSTAVMGSWNGSFFGAAGQIDPDNGGPMPAVNTAPAAVIGEFNANFTDGTTAGAFGVRKQ